MPPGISEKVLIPKTEPEQEAYEVYVTNEETDAILAFLKKYEYTSLRHALFITLRKTGIRSGTLRGLDLEDFKPQVPALEIKHRSTSGTPLKNKCRTPEGDESGVTDGWNPDGLDCRETA